MVTLLTDHHHTGGIYHAGASDSISRYEMGRCLAARLSIPDRLVEPQTVPIPGRAPRGECHFLLTEKLDRLLGIETQTCDQVIERCFS